MFSGLGDNSAELIAVVFVAGILGSRQAFGLLRRWLSHESTALILTVYLLFVALLAQHLYGFTPLGDRYALPEIGSHQRLADRFVAMIPPGVPVSTQDQLDPHLSSRHYVYLFEDTGDVAAGFPAAGYILLDVSAPTYPLPSYQLHDAIQSYLRRPDWGIAAAADGLILVKKGAPHRTPPPSFYRFALSVGKAPSHRITLAAQSLQLTGYDVQQSDAANHRVPNQNLTFYARVKHSIRIDLQPVEFEVMGKRMIGCAHEPLGLAWLPTSKWRPHQTYVVHMEPLETNWQGFGTSQLYVELNPVSQSHGDCATLWLARGKMRPVGDVALNP
jgi:hypothetical protein